MNIQTPPPIGHNKPPESAFLLTTSRIQDLFDEAKNWLDGDALTTDEQHSKVVELVKSLRKASAEADAARKAEAKPYDDAKKDIQARYNPFIQKGKGLVDLAIDTANEVLAPYLAKKVAEKEEAERKARAEADAKAKAAQEAMQQSRDDLEQRQKAEDMLEQAKIAERVAKKVERTSAVKGSRTVTDVTITDMKEAGRIAWIADPDAFHELVLSVGKRLVRENNVKTLGGFSIIERKVV